MTLFTRLGAAWRVLHERRDEPPEPSAIGLSLFERLGAREAEQRQLDLQRLANVTYRHRIPRVRVHNGGSPANASRILSLLDGGYPVLSVVPFGYGYGPVGFGMALQLDDEPDAQSPAVSPEHYGETFRFTMAAMRETLPATIPIVTAGFSPRADIEWIRRALVAGASDADAVCFHVAGVDLLAAVCERLGVLRTAMLHAGCARPLWITSLRPPNLGAAEQAAAIKRLVKSKVLRQVERAYFDAPLVDAETLRDAVRRA
jgi:hypothetical protein